MKIVCVRARSGEWHFEFLFSLSRFFSLFLSFFSFFFAFHNFSFGFFSFLFFGFFAAHLLICKVSLVVQGEGEKERERWRESELVGVCDVCLLD